MRNIIRISLCTVIMLFSLVGCKSTGEEVIVEEPTNTPTANAKVMAPDIVGEVLEVNEDGKGILVESKNASVNGQIWVTITEETSFFEEVSEEAALAYHNVSREFEVGNHVEIISNGLILESYPMQTTAVAVAINEKK